MSEYCPLSPTQVDDTKNQPAFKTRSKGRRLFDDILLAKIHGSPEPILVRVRCDEPTIYK